MQSAQAQVQKKKSTISPMDLVVGGVLQMIEAATLGMPFEVWKTRMGRFREETTLQSFRAIKNQGYSTFWKGLSPKLVESASKGSILLFSKEAIYTFLTNMGTGSTLSGFAAGAGGGICQVVVMGPCTFIVTAMVTGSKNISAVQHVQLTFSNKGVKGFYAGGSAIAFRQASNWASRQGITEFVRNQFKDSDGKVSKGKDIASGMIGGALSCWNHPFEVARIEMQARANQGQGQLSLSAVIGMIYKEYGFSGLFKGVIPRVGLGIWQTLFMVTAAKIVREQMGGAAIKH